MTQCAASSNEPVGGEPVISAEIAKSRSLLARGWPLVVLGAILALGLVLRFYQLDRRSMWLDEFWAMAVSAGHALESGRPEGVVIDPAPPPPTYLEHAVPWHQVWFATGETTHPPLYYVVLRLWREAFGGSQAVARGMSVFFSMIALALMYDVARLILGRRAALWSTLLMAVAVPQIVHAQEIRNYAPQVALALGAALAVVRIEKLGTSKLRLIGLTLSLVALLLTHYFSVGFAAGLLLYAALTLRGAARWKALGAFAAAAALFLVMWGPRFYVQLGQFGVSATENNWLFDPSPGRWWRALKQAALVPAELICPLDEKTASFAYLGAALYLVPLLLWRRRPELRLPALWLAASVGMLLALDIARSSMHLSHLRYSYVASPAVYLVLVGMVSQMRVIRHILPALAALSCALPLRTHYEDAYVDWRWPAEEMGLGQLLSPGDVVVFSSEGGPPYQAYQSFIVLSHYYGQIPGPIVIAPERPPADTIAELRQLGRETWLITGVGWVYPDQILPGAKIHVRHQYLGTVDIWRATWPDEDKAPAEP